MTALQFLQKYLEIEPERFETDADFAIYDLMVEGSSYKEFKETLVDLMETYHQINSK